MRNMMQLLGGIVVAGAVAAGATAFTGSGVTIGAGAASAIAGGVSGNVTVDGATLDNVSVINSVTPGQFSAIKVKLSSTAAAAPIISGTVTVKVAGTSTGSDAIIGTAVTCSHTTLGVWNCPGTGSDEWLTISGITVEVSNGDTI